MQWLCKAWLWALGHGMRGTASLLPHPGDGVTALVARACTMHRDFCPKERSSSDGEPTRTGR